jgi:hypothetical protein
MGDAKVQAERHIGYTNRTSSSILLSTRMTQDKRQNTRVKTSLNCHFGPTKNTPCSGTVTSLSSLACFIKTKRLVAKDDKLHFKLWLPEDLWSQEDPWLRLQGTVLYIFGKIGFSLMFTELDPDKENTLRKLIDRAQPLQTSGNGEENLSPE